MSILKPSDPLLRTVCIPVSKKELKKKETQKLINTLLEYVYANNHKEINALQKQPITVGLSANQIGILKRISAVDLGIGHKGYNDIHIIVNPEIIWHSKTSIEHTEGCVNLPNIWGFVKRFRKIKVHALDRSGNELVLTLEGWPAVLLQHEIGHLNGELFIDKLENPKKAHLVEVSDYKLYKKMRRKWSKFIDVSDLVENKSKSNNENLLTPE